MFRSALQNLLGVAFGAQHPVTAWLVEHAGDLISKYHVGVDGKTSYERAKSKKFNKDMCEFGEII